MPIHDPTILVVDDQQTLVSSIELTLESASFYVLTAFNGQEALELLKRNNISLILADISMPIVNGYQLYKLVRQNPEWIHIPFIFLTARTFDSDIRFGKEMGVDAYLTKPCEPEDLLATVRGSLKRVQQWMQSKNIIQPLFTQDEVKPTITIGKLEINPNQHQVWYDNQPILLSIREFRLLYLLAQYPNQLMKPVDLVKNTHNINAEEQEASNLIRPLIRTLRRKLNYSTSEERLIETVRGVGYRLLDEKTPV